MGIASLLKNPQSRNWRSVPRTYMSAAGFQSEVHPTNLAKVAVHEAKFRKEVNIFREDLQQSVERLSRGQRMLKRNLKEYKIRMWELRQERIQEKLREANEELKREDEAEEKDEKENNEVETPTDKTAESNTQEQEHKTEETADTENIPHENITNETPRKLKRQMSQRRVLKRVQMKKPSPALVVVQNEPKFASIYSLEDEALMRDNSEKGDYGYSLNKRNGEELTDTPKGEHNATEQRDEVAKDHSNDEKRDDPEKEDVRIEIQADEEEEKEDPFPKISSRVLRAKRAGDKFMQLVRAKKTIHMASKFKLIDDIIEKSKSRQFNNSGMLAKRNSLEDIEVNESHLKSQSDVPILPAIKEERGPAGLDDVDGYNEDPEMLESGQDEVQSASGRLKYVEHTDNSHSPELSVRRTTVFSTKDDDKHLTLPPINNTNIRTGPIMQRKPIVLKEENKTKYHKADIFLKEEKIKCLDQKGHVTWKQSLEKLRYVHYLPTNDIV